MNELCYILFCTKSLKFYPSNTPRSRPATFHMLSTHTGLVAPIAEQCSYRQMSPILGRFP